MAGFSSQAAESPGCTNPAPLPRRPLSIVPIIASSAVRAMATDVLPAGNNLSGGQVDVLYVSPCPSGFIAI
ncbi:hypothetical protein ACP4OV_013299 [Aristida adscensionis]